MFPIFHNIYKNKLEKRTKFVEKAKKIAKMILNIHQSQKKSFKKQNITTYYKIWYK